MHRTQILLDDWQYEMLKAAAERKGRSMSSLIRDAVSAFLGKQRRPDTTRLAEIAGIGEDCDAGGRDHDEVLYKSRGDHS